VPLASPSEQLIGLENLKNILKAEYLWNKTILERFSSWC